MTLGGFLTELVDVCLPCDGLPPAAAAAAPVAPSASTSVSPAIMAAFSFRGTFHVAISSSSIGEMPRAKKGLRCRRYLQQIKIAPTTSNNPTTESTLLKVITSVLLLLIPAESLLGPASGVSGERVVVESGGKTAELVSVGIVSVTESEPGGVGAEDGAGGSLVG